MIFYKSITICNLFAYYGKQSVDFEAKDGKPLYLIYGNNGFGKTSFIRSMKLLFLGSGLNKGEVPSAISNFVDKNRGKFTPKVFLLGSGGEKIWEGALNKQACSEEQNEYFDTDDFQNFLKKHIGCRRNHIEDFTAKTNINLSKAKRFP